MKRLFGAVRRPVGKALSALPEPVQMVLNPRKYGYRPEDVPPPVTPPSGAVRLLIAPVNFSGQAYHWARAAEKIPGVGATNMQYRKPAGDFGFPCDYEVPVRVFARSAAWASRQFDAVVDGFSHVLIEAVRPIFGSRFGGDVVAEVRALRAAGVKVGIIVHGSEVRVPSRHAETSPWSPFRDGEWELTDRLEEQTRRSLAIIEELDVPVFASTATLEQFVPRATWLPLVVDPDAWTGGDAALGRDVPIVAHVPSSGVVKGTHFVREAVAPLVADGRIEYREITGVPSEDMPQIYRDADVVIDGLRMGNYGVASCEAMAGGRLAVVFLDAEAIREANEYGTVPPVARADPGSLADVLRDVVDRREHYGRLAAQGAQFVREVHDGRRSAEALRSFLQSDDAGALA